VQRLERLVVHVEEALRIAQNADEAHLRVALVLLDSAAELLMHRECSELLHEESFEFGQLQALESSQRYFEKYRGAEYEAYAEKLRAKVTSKARRREIDRDFNAKAKFLAEKGCLPFPQDRVLRKLHQYRNEAYHRDNVRSDTLRSAIDIYAFLACDMMQRFAPRTIIGRLARILQ
jgi:hypothetical protein